MTKQSKTKHPKPRTITRDVSIYLTGDGELLVEREDNTMSIALTSTAALKLIKTDDLALAKRQHAIIVTRVTWHPAFVTTEP